MKTRGSIVRKNGVSYLLPFIMVTSLFFLWGFAHGILDVLNKHFQDVLVISKARSALVQAAVYGAYFLMALPAGHFIQKKGYRRGVVLGLLLYGIGAFMFIPGKYLMSFPFFLLSLFVIGAGLTFLETSANPYITVLGEADMASARLNLSQSFNGLGWIFGPMIGSLLILSDRSNIAIPYAVIGLVVLMAAGVFIRMPLPEPEAEAPEDDGGRRAKSIWHCPTFVFGLVSLFLYVAAQTGINSFFINYSIENVSSLSAQNAGLILSFGGMGLFMAGRLAGSLMMGRWNGRKLLAIDAAVASVLMIIVILQAGWISMMALIAVYLFESIMFPTIFSLSIKGLGANTKKASSFLIMSIVGGAIAPLLMGLIGEQNMAVGFIVPLICFLVILVYALFAGSGEAKSCNLSV